MVASGQGRSRVPLHAREHPSLAGLCTGIWTLTPRALQGHTIHWHGVAPLWFCLVPFPLSPILPPGCAGTHLPTGRESTPAFAGGMLQAGTRHCRLFFHTGQDQNNSVSPLLSSCYGHHPGHASFPWPLCCHSAQTLASAIAVAVAATCSG